MDEATRNGFQKLEELEEKVRRAVEDLKTLRGSARRPRPKRKSSAPP